MRAMLWVWLSGCGGATWETEARPVDYQAPPGAQQLLLDGPTAVHSGELQTWVVSAPDLVAGTEVYLGWGSTLGPGRCPFRQRVGGWLCLDIAGVRPLQSTVAIDDPGDPSRVIASFDITVPATPESLIYLQALSVDGQASATSQPLAVGLNGTQPPVDRGGLLAWWDFENGSTADLSGNGHDASLESGAAFAAGQVGDAIDVTGVAHLSFPTTPDFNAATELTVTAWVFQTATLGSPGVIAKAPRGGAIQDWGFYLSNTLPAFDANFPCCEQFYAATVGGVPAGWHHVAGSYSSAGGEARFYVDGVLTDTAAVVPLLTQGSATGVIGSDGGAPNDFSGLLDEIMVWSRVLSDAEVAEVMNGNIAP